jgi:hypothetical protein
MDFWKSFSSKLQIARQLAWRDWFTLVEAWWVLLGFRLAMRWVNFDRLEAFTQPAEEGAINHPDALEWAHRRQRLISLAGRLHIPAMKCLPRALALRWMLSRHAIPSQLRIGMNKASTGFFAHAWVEVDGEAVGEPEDITGNFMVLQSPG